MTRERFSLKDHLFNAKTVSHLGGLLANGVPGFDREGFERSVLARLPDLELKQRIAAIAGVLADHLDPDFQDLEARRFEIAATTTSVTSSSPPLGSSSPARVSLIPMSRCLSFAG
jgi:hypothetical protein